jgi:transcriptional regulator with XRE-family HTH domain
MKPKLLAATKNKILRADLANIARKLSMGKTLTADERARIEASEAAPEPSAATYTELAQVLGITARHLRTWRTMEGAPSPLPNGEHSLAAWRDFQTSINGKGRIPTDDDQPEFEGILKRRKLKLQIEERSIAHEVRRAELLDAELVQRTWQAKSSAAGATLAKMLSPALAKKLQGLEAPEIVESLAGIVDGFVAQMKGAPAQRH